MLQEAAFLPNPGPQSMFVSSPVKDVCYGGARGGGKSIGLFLAFREYASMYGAAARGIIFRKTYTELEDLIAKCRRWLTAQENSRVDRWGYNQTAHTAICETGPAKGATLTLRYLRDMKDAAVYAGHEYPWQGFDEIENWPDPGPLDLLMGSMRTDSAIPTYRRSTCMPGGAGHVWVKERYQPESPFVIRRRRPLKDRRDLVIETLFIPALLEDNPRVSKSDYELDMAAIGNSKLYRAWRYGHWNLIAGAFFDNWDEDVHVIEQEKAVFEPWHPRWMSCDWGFRDDCIVQWHTIDEHGVITTYDELKFNDTPPMDVGRSVGKHHRDSKYGPQKCFALGRDAWAKRGSPKTISEQIHDGIFEETKDIPWPMQADDDREGGWMLLYQLLQSRLWRVTRNCRELIRALPVMQHDPTNSADIADSKLDHAPDTARYGLKTYLAGANVPIEEQIRRRIVEQVPEAGLSPQAFSELPEEHRSRVMNKIAFLDRREEKTRAIPFRKYRSFRTRIGA